MLFCIDFSFNLFKRLNARGHIIYTHNLVMCVFNSFYLRHLDSRQPELNPGVDTYLKLLLDLAAAELRKGRTAVVSKVKW